MTDGPFRVPKGRPFHIQNIEPIDEAINLTHRIPLNESIHLTFPMCINNGDTKRLPKLCIYIYMCVCV